MLHRNERIAELFPPMAFDPYEDAKPVLVCPECGEPVYIGEKYICLHGTNRVIACEHCADINEADFL